jgi:hypothetical protein
MQDDTRYGAPTLTIEDARALVGRIAAVLSERYGDEIVSMWPRRALIEP